MKKAVKVIVCLVLVLVLIVIGYLAYVLIDYHRIGNEVIDRNPAIAEKAEVNKEYDMVSWNIGFGAYESDYGFFMDGGTESRARSKERLHSNMEKIGSLLDEQEAQFLLLQEVDTDATRTYHVDEYAMLKGRLREHNYDDLYVCNYDSPYLMYPLTRPHGKSVSGIATFSQFGILSAERMELPVEDSLMKLVDLDRCYAKSYIPVSDGRELVLFNVHLSAYTSDGAIATEQLQMLLQDMQSEYEAGNYAVCGGDFNKDILGDSSVYFGKADVAYNWAQPLPEGIFEGTNLTLIAPLNEAQPVPSCRNADGPYHAGQFVLTVDGFIVSDNVSVSMTEVIDTGFAYSDHNPVHMSFKLAE